MTGISYEVSVQDETVQKKLDELLDRMDNRRGFFVNVGEQLLNSAKTNFEKEAGPDGIPWQRLLPKTIQRREEKGLTPIRVLRARGRLAGTINYLPSDDNVRIGSPMEYAAIHQLGGEIEKPERTGTIYQHYDPETDEFDQRFRKKSQSTFAREVKFKAHSIRMPARPFIGVSKADETAIVEIAEDWLDLK